MDCNCHVIYATCPEINFVIWPQNCKELEYGNQHLYGNVMSLFIPGAHIISKLVDLFCVLLFLYSIFDICSYCRNLLTWIWVWILIWNKFLFFTLWLSVFSASMILLVSSMWDSVCLRNEVLNGDATLLIINVHAILIPNFLSSLFHFFKHLSLPFAHMFNTLFYSMIPKNN